MAVFKRSDELKEAIFAVVIPAILQVRSLGSISTLTTAIQTNTLTVMRLRIYLCFFSLVAVFFSLSACSGTPALIGQDIEVRNAEIEEIDDSQDENVIASGELTFSEGLSSTSNYRNISRTVMVFTLKNSEGDNVQSINASPGKGYSMSGDVYSISLPQEDVSAEAIPTDEWVNFEIKGDLPDPVRKETAAIEFDTVMGEYQ